jgi:hypothetical protein
MIYFLLLLLAYITHWQWTTNLSILTSGDWIYQDPEMLKQFFSIPSLWTTSALGMIDLGISFAPFNFIYSILSKWHVNYGLAERIVFLWPILIASPIGSYLFIKKNVPNKLAAVIGSLVYSYNTYFTLTKTGHLTLLAAYSFMPFVFLFYQKALEKKELKYSLLAGFFCFIVSFYEFRAFYILFFLLFFYFLFYIFFINKVKSIKAFVSTAFFAGMPIVIVIILNLYWLLGLGNTGALVSNGVFSRVLFGNEFLNILHAISFHHPFWTGTKSAVFEIQLIPFYFWFIPIFAFLGLYLNRRKKTIIFFGLISLLGIFLTKQVAPPFPDVYPWLYQYFPGFNAFREASKFYLLIAIGYSILIAAFVDWIWKEKRVSNYGKYLIISLIALLFVSNLKPLITGEYATLFVSRQVPNDYLILKRYLLSDNSFSRTLWIPVFSRWSFYNNNHPEIGGVDSINTQWNDFIKSKRTDKITEAELVVDALQLPYANNVLDRSSIRYIIVPTIDTANDDNFLPDYKKARKFYTDSLKKLPFLKKKNIGTNELQIYENASFRPHIYITDQKETLQKELPYKKVTFKAVSPTEYSIRLTNIIKPVYLNFAESFHPDWRLHTGKFSWKDSLTNSNYFIAKGDHFQNDAKLNSYYLDPSKICNEKKCTINRDGSYSLDLTLYFEPQAYVRIGLLVSIVGFFVLLIAIYMSFIRKGNHEKKIQ